MLVNMPRIRLTNKEAINVSKETAERVDKEWRQGQKVIKIGNRTFKRGRISEVNLEDDNREVKRYNLLDAGDRVLIEAWREKLEAIKKQELPKPIEYYGEVVKEIKMVVGVNAGKVRKFDPPLVYNRILGLTHPQIVQYCLDNKVITRRGENDWAIICIGYSNWLEKKNALTDLRFLEAKGQKESKAIEEINKPRSLKEEIDILPIIRKI